VHIAPFIPHYIITFVTEFSRNSRISDIQSVPYSSPTNPSPTLLCVHTSHRICASLRIKSRAARVASALPFDPLSRRDANESKYGCHDYKWTINAEKNCEKTSIEPSHSEDEVREYPSSQQ